MKSLSVHWAMKLSSLQIKMTELPLLSPCCKHFNFKGKLKKEKNKLSNKRCVTTIRFELLLLPIRDVKSKCIWYIYPDQDTCRWPAHRNEPQFGRGACSRVPWKVTVDRHGLGWRICWSVEQWKMIAPTTACRYRLPLARPADSHHRSPTGCRLCSLWIR